MFSSLIWTQTTFWHVIAGKPPAVNTKIVPGFVHVGKDTVNVIGNTCAFHKMTRWKTYCSVFFLISSAHNVRFELIFENFFILCFFFSITSLTHTLKRCFRSPLRQKKNKSFTLWKIPHLHQHVLVDILGQHIWGRDLLFGCMVKSRYKDAKVAGLKKLTSFVYDHMDMRYLAPCTYMQTK